VVDWPITLPPIPQLPVTITFPDNVIRTPTDVGPGFVRRRSTAAAAPYRFRIVFENQGQLTTFHQFWRDTLSYGSLPFNHYYGLTPPSGSPLEPLPDMRFTEPPEVTALGGGRFEAILSLEILP
jgi:hypothetical protein